MQGKRPLVANAWVPGSNSKFGKCMTMSHHYFYLAKISLTMILIYCKTLITRMTLFSRNHRSSFIHETLFSRLIISSSIIFTLQIIGEDFIFASLCSREFTQK